MAPRSWYHRGASSHYQSAARSHEEQMFASPATTWQSSPHPPGPSSAPFSPSAHRPLPDYSGSTNYVNHPSWPTSSYYAYRTGWTDAREDDAFVSRSTAPYGDAGAHTATASVPPPDSSASRQRQRQRQHQQPHQHASNPPHEVHLLSSSEAAYGAAERLDHLRVSPAEYSAASNPAPFPPHHAQRSAPVAGLLNAPQQITALHVNPPQLPLQPPVSWGAVPICDVPPAGPPQLPSLACDTLSSTTIAPVHGTLSGSSWGSINTGEPPSASPAHERLSGEATGWPILVAQPEDGGYLHQPPQIPQPPSLNAPHRGTRRAAATKSAKVPSAYIERQEKHKISKRRGPLEEEKRRKTHYMRKDKKVCVRCRFYKSGCDDGDPCKKCIKIEGNARSFREPCFRHHLEDASLVRHCNGRFNQEEAEFLGYEWVPGSLLYEMAFIWSLPGFGPVCVREPMRIAVRQYNPKRAILETATSIWRNTDGEVNTVQQPPYAIYDTVHFAATIERYFYGLQPEIENWIYTRVRYDEIAHLTYQEVARVRATKPSNRPNLLDLAMRLQCLSVVSQGYGTVWSNDIPGIQEYDYRKLGRSNYEAYDRNSRDRPLPGMVNHQFDVAVLQYLKKLEKSCVKELSAQIFKPKIKPWYELFLTFFVLLWNLEYIHYGAEGYIMSKIGTMIESQVSNVVRKQINKWDFSFDVLMRHWRCILRGYEPFKLARENPEEFREKGHIEPEGFQYVMKIASIFDRQGPDRFAPPVTGPGSLHNSMASQWIMQLFKETGA